MMMIIIIIVIVIISIIVIIVIISCIIRPSCATAARWTTSLASTSSAPRLYIYIYMHNL